MIQKEPLTSEERKAALEDLPGNIIGALIILGLLAGLIILQVHSTADVLRYFLFLPIGILIYYTYLVVYLAIMDYSCGYKLVLSGKITNKKEVIKSGGSTSIGGGSYAGGHLQSSSTTTRHEDTLHYYFWIEGEKVKVTRKEFETHAIGEEAKINAWPYSRISLAQD